MKQILPCLSTLSFVAACGGASPEARNDVSSDPLVEIERSYAGIDTADEAPEFGDEQVRAQDRADAEVSLRDPPERDRPLLGAVILSLRYGQLADVRGAPTTTVSDGAHWRFRVNAVGGAFARARLYVERDENPELTQVGRGVVTWHSSTPAGDTDGARFAIVFDGSSEGLVVSTAGAEFAIPARDLAHHESVHLTDNGRLHLRTYRVVRDGGGSDLCAGGTIRGRVSGLNGDGVGEVVGVIRNHEGDTVGHLRGRYGVRDNGDQVFFAKLIGRRGEFMGRARGTYERLDDGTVAVLARFHERDGRAAGIIRGQIVADDERRGAAFLARWALVCDESMPRDRLPPESDQAERSRGVN